jgi:aerobic-type carbon monoxide dehydrogenase small subunit (CoxS/CutS family)
MADQTTLILNGNEVAVSSSPDTPLLYVLSDELQLQGPRFGCGLAQCGSCSVLIDGVETRSCVTPLSAVTGKRITTLEGLPALFAEAQGLERVPEFTPLQQAMIDEQALQCGYCYNGMLIKATELLNNNPAPSDAEVRSAMNGHLCRCGTYPKILSAIRKAAATGAAAETRGAA